MRKKPKLNLSKKSREVLKITSTCFVFVIFFGAASLLANYNFFQNRFLIGTKIGDLNVSGLTFTQARDLIDEQISNYYEQGITLSLRSETIPFYAKDIDLQVSYLDKLGETFRSQHQDTNPPRDLFYYAYRQFTQKETLVFDIEYSITKLNQSIYQKYPEVSLLSEPQIEYQDGKFIIIPGSNGEKIVDESVKLLTDSLSILSRQQIMVEMENTFPTVSDEEAQIVADKANEILGQTIVLRAGNISITESFANHPEWFDFELSAEEKENALFSQPIYFKFGLGVVAGEATRPMFSILLDPREVEYFIDKNVVSRLPGHAQNIYLKLNENGEIVVEGTLQNGIALDTSQAVQLIVDNFDKNVFENNLPVSVQEGKVIDNTGLNLGIEELLATGESDFSHSEPNRVNNVKVGLSHFQNIFIPPGGVFNYADYIGPIDAAHGFLPGWVIKNRTRLAREYGGGICQTSTTIFRAAFYAGLPILERHPHGYDVEYYRWPAVGLDASVYVPYASLRFKNDTPGHILIQQAVNTDTNRAYVWIYGTDDGRKVEVTGPNVYGKYYAASSIEDKTSDLAPGEKKLVHGAVAGLQTDWFRKVTYPNGEVANYNVHSSYAAVPATYLVGE